MPEDFDALFTYFAPIIVEPTIINLDFVDILNVCNFDLEKKTCKNGYLKLFNYSNTDFNISDLRMAFHQIDLKNCCACILMLSGNFSLIEPNDICHFIKTEISDEGNILFGARYEETANHLNINILFRFINTPSKHRSKLLPVDNQ